MHIFLNPFSSLADAIPCHNMATVGIGPWGAAHAVTAVAADPRNVPADALVKFTALTEGRAIDLSVSHARRPFGPRNYINVKVPQSVQHDGVGPQSLTSRATKLALMMAYEKGFYRVIIPPIDRQDASRLHQMFGTIYAYWSDDPRRMPHEVVIVSEDDRFVTSANLYLMASGFRNWNQIDSGPPDNDSIVGELYFWLMENYRRKFTDRGIFSEFVVRELEKEGDRKFILSMMEEWSFETPAAFNKEAISALGMVALRGNTEEQESAMSVLVNIFDWEGRVAGKLPNDCPAGRTIAMLLAYSRSKARNL